MWVLGWGSRCPLWSRWRAAEDPQWSKPPQTHPCSQYFMGQCWITKTCHHETPDLDWGLLQSAVRSTFELPRPPSIHFFALVAWRKLREGSDQKSCLLSLPTPHHHQKKWCNEGHDECFTASRTLHLFYLSASSGRWSSSDRCAEQNSEYMNQKESDTMTGGKKDWRLFPPLAGLCCLSPKPWKSALLKPKKLDCYCHFMR